MWNVATTDEFYRAGVTGMQKELDALCENGFDPSR